MRILLIISIITSFAFSVGAQDKSVQQDTTKTHFTDTLKIKAQGHLPDSTELANKAKQEAQQSLKEELDSSIPTDSSQVINKAESIATETINNETDIQINGVPKNSTEIANKVEQLATEELNNAGIEVNGILTPIGGQATDSASVKNEAKQLAKDQFKDHTGIDAPDITLDSTTTTQIKEGAEKRAEAAIKDTDHMKALNGSDGELGKLTDTKEQIEKTQAELKEMKSRKAMKQKMAGHAKEFIQENAEQIQQVQSKMGELKQKYSSVVNSNDLSTATKRSSLKGEPFWKRLVIGGNLNLSETNPLSIDFAPVLGWKFNKLFEAGVTGAYRAKFGADKAGVNTFENEEVYGYSVFANHMVFKNFFGYLEGENMSTVTGNSEESERSWKQSLLVGIGRKFKIAKFLEMQAIVSYNFLHDNSDGVYNSPVVFKTGVRVVK